MSRSKSPSIESPAKAAAATDAASPASAGPMPASRAGGGGGGVSVWAKALAGAAKDKDANPSSSFEEAAGGGGAKLPYQAEMEEAFGQDFSDVKVSTGKKDTLDGIGAKAATDGERVAFADANPDKETVAHELTHVVQKRGGGGEGVRGKMSSPSDSSEREANSVASTVAGGGKAPPVSGGLGGAGVLRDTAEETDAGPECSFLDAMMEGTTATAPISFKQEFAIPMEGVKDSPKLSLEMEGTLQTSPELKFTGTGSLGFTAPGMETKIAIDEQGFSLFEFGLKVGPASLKQSFEKDQVGIALGFEKEGVAGGTLDFKFTPKEVHPTLELWFDVLGVLFGGALEELNEYFAEWEPAVDVDEGDASNFDAMQRMKGISLSLDTKFSMILDFKDGLNPRLENQKMELGAAIMAGDGDTAMGAGVSFSVESDYATGEDGDPFSTTTVKSEAFVQLSIGGVTWKPSVSLESTQIGTWLETADAAEEIASTCLLAAYKSALGKRGSYISEGLNSQKVAQDLVEKRLAELYPQACNDLESQTGAKLSIRRKDFDVYYLAGGAAKGDTTTNYEFTTNWIKLANAVIKGDNEARIVHEDIIFDGNVAIAGAYKATFGDSEHTINFSRDGDGWVGTWEGGILWASQSTNVLDVEWAEGDQTGACVLQIQDMGKRLFGNRETESRKATWTIEQA